MVAFEPQEADVLVKPRTNVWSLEMSLSQEFNEHNQPAHTRTFISSVQKTVKY